MSLTDMLFGGWGEAAQDVWRLGVEMTETAGAAVRKFGADVFLDREASVGDEFLAEAFGQAPPALPAPAPTVAQESLTAIMHDLPELGGKGLVGTFNMSSAEDLETVKNIIEKVKFKETPASFPRPETFKRVGDTWLERQQVTLENVGVEMQDLSGTNVTPIELRLYADIEEKAPDVVTQLELRTVELPVSVIRTGLGNSATQLSGSAFGPGGNIKPFEIEEAPAPELGKPGTGWSRSAPVKEPQAPEAGGGEYKGPMGKLNKGTWQDASGGGDYEGVLGKLNKGEWQAADESSLVSRLTSHEDLVGGLEEPLIPKALEMVSGAEEMLAEFEAGTLGSALWGPGIGIALYIFQQLWTMNETRKTDDLREIGLMGHEFAAPGTLPEGGLDVGLLGYASHFWEWWDKSEVEYELEHHKKYEWGDPSIWLPVRILDHYDILVGSDDARQHGYGTWCF